MTHPETDPKLPTSAPEPSRWNARQRELVRLFTDPTMPCFLNQTASAKAAGLNHAAGRRIFSYGHVQEEIARIFAERVEAGKDLGEMLWEHRHAAVRKLLEGVHAGENLRLIDPEKEFGEGFEDAMEVVLDGDGNPVTNEEGEVVVIDQTPRLREINRHNKVKKDLLRESRQAAMDVLAYAYGTPEQVIRHKSDDTPDARALEDMDREKIMDLREIVERELDKRVQKKGAAEVTGDDDDPVDADYEILDG